MFADDIKIIVIVICITSDSSLIFTKVGNKV